MSESRFIDVVATARINLIADRYRATVTFAVETGRKRACLAESIALRDRVIAALKAAGIAEADIEEGGGEVRDHSWSGKQVDHHVHVEHAEMSVLIKAMAHVESVFTSIKRPWFSGVKHTFRFGAPQPQFKPDIATKEQMLQRAMESARKKAQALAGGAGLRIGEVLSIIELPPRPELELSHSRNEIQALTVDDSLSLDCMLEAAPEYAPAARLRSTGQQVFRVRFGVTTA